MQKKDIDNDEPSNHVDDKFLFYIYADNYNTECTDRINWQYFYNQIDTMLLMVHTHKYSSLLEYEQLKKQQKKKKRRRLSFSLSS